MDGILITTFLSPPPFAQGLIRDLRVRWALEEAGLAYAADAAMDRTTAAYRARQPFGLAPAVQADGRDLFETGAVVHLIAEDSEVLMPSDRIGRHETLAWMFAALDTVEKPVWSLFLMDTRHKEQAWAAQARPGEEEVVRKRLASLAARLTGRDYLTGRFSAADILMVTVLRFLRHTDLVSGVPQLDAYVRRCEARPAFQKAVRDQLADYDRHAAAAA